MIKRFLTSVWAALIGCIDRGEILPDEDVLSCDEADAYGIDANEDVDEVSDNVFGDYVEYVAFETVTEQVGAL